MKKISIALAAIVVLAAIPAGLLLRTERISGDELRKLIDTNNANSYASWYLYKIDKEQYCFKYSRPLIPKKYCVPTTDLEVHNSPDGSAVFGYMGKSDLFLKEGRHPGARRESIP